MTEAFVRQQNSGDFINKHKAKSSREKIALVVEGGGMRSIFSAGVLDSFLAQDFDPFSLYLGVSAGCLNLTSHLAGQYLRNYRVMLHCARSGRFINGWKYLSGGHYIDLDWLNGDCMRALPLDTEKAIEKIKNPNKEFLVVCTRFKDGVATYYNPIQHDLLTVLLGSCSIPLLYRRPVYIAGERVLDGGISDPIPVKKAYQTGATDIIVIRSRDKCFRESPKSFDKKIACFIYKNNPGLKKAIENLHQVYNSSVDFIESHPGDVRLFQIAPKAALHTNLITTDPDLLTVDYQYGRQLGELFVHDWQKHA